MGFFESKYSYILLTNEVPTQLYDIGNEHNIRPIELNNEFLTGYHLDDDKFNTFFALTHVNDTSYQTYKDLVVFHSFISNNHRTYEFAETANEVRFLDSKLKFIEDISNENQDNIIALDFNFFPLYTGLQKTNVYKYTKLEYINYRKAFNLFSKLVLSKKTKQLYDQVYLYYYAKTLESVNRIYSNSYLVVALYISILESIIGKPQVCHESFTCPRCGAKVSEHYVKSLEKHFTTHYGGQFGKLRNIRHKTFHEGNYHDLTSTWLHAYLKAYKASDMSNTDLQNIYNIQHEIMELGIIVEDQLINAFLTLY